MSIGEAVFYIGSFITVMGSLTIILRALLSPIREQVYNHLPSGIKRLEDNQREMRKELRGDIKALDQRVYQNYKALDQKIDQNYKALDQKFDQNNQKIDQNFKELISLITKQRTGS